MFHMPKCNKGEIDLDIMNKIIYANNSLGNLAKDMNEIGFDFSLSRKGKKKAYERALEYWIRKREDDYPLESIQLLTPKEMPQTIFGANEKSYHIVGVPHGEEGKNYWLYYSKNIGSILANNEKDAVIFLEDGFENYAPIKHRSKENIIPFKDCSVMTDKYKRFISKLMHSGFLNRICIKLLNRISRNPIYDVLEKTNMLEDLLKKQSMAEINEAKGLIMHRELNKRATLPEPLTSEYLSLLHSSYERIHTKRSELMARKLIENHNEYPKNYAFVGQAHEPLIEYLFKSDFGEIYTYPENLSYYRYEK